MILVEVLEDFLDDFLVVPDFFLGEFLLEYLQGLRCFCTIKRWLERRGDAVADRIEWQRLQVEHID